MKVTVTVQKEVEAKTLHVDAGVRYWEDADVNGVCDEEGDLMPCRDGERWKPIIDIETGVITNWTQGVKASVHYKVCDDGTYTLKDENGKDIIAKDGYVPEIMCPKEEGYGDYIIMEINEDGQIDNWKQTIKGFGDED
jgi:hypothetical protein